MQHTKEDLTVVQLYIVGRGLAPGIPARSALLVATFPRGEGRTDRAGREVNSEERKEKSEEKQCACGAEF